MNKQSLQIKKLTTINYKNLNQNQGIELQPLNILIGANGSGRFYNANDMSLKAIRDTYPKIGANDIFLSATCENLPLVLDNLMQHPNYGIDFE
ncbi:hypothetical protein THIOM_003692 [Candidatus Thiomargarita nelsonii]|uniref:Uncharacterized protein n=1 Tax=Candidatus Thiomargarita nelsonii TaxID=1003181 RepID=A0A0A6P0A0_9GAMM|nr:hypothetical protein THIOM_003692 [Candidatus Thiomargarita nelsonii]